MENNGIELIDLSLIDPPSEADRDMIDPDKIRELAESIRSQGLHSPVLLRPRNGRFEIVFGHRRFLAHRLLGELSIRSMIKEMTDDQVFETRAVENDQREDLNPIERAKTYKRLRERFGLSNREIGRRMGRSLGSINRYFEILEVPEEFYQAIAQKKLSMEVAVILNEIDEDTFKAYYFNMAIQNGVTRDVARLWVDDWVKTRSGSEQSESGGDSQPAFEFVSKPVYLTCEGCHCPVEIKEVRSVALCLKCARVIREGKRG